MLSNCQQFEPNVRNIRTETNHRPSNATEGNPAITSFARNNTLS